MSTKFLYPENETYAGGMDHYRVRLDSKIQKSNSRRKSQ